MKKHIIAAAVAAAVAVPAAAQVTISGSLDLSPHSSTTNTVGTTSVKVSGTGNDTSTGHATTNRMNFTFSEDLGGGLKADGLYRLRFGSNTGSSGTADDMSLRLTGGFGALRFGRFSGFIGNVEAMSGQFSATGTAGGIGHGGANFIGGTMQVNAASITAPTGALVKATAGSGAHDDTQGIVQYVSPSFSGFNVTLDFVNRTSDESTTAGNGKIKQQGIGLSYVAGPLTVQAANSEREVTGGIDAAPRTEAQVAAKGKIDWVAANYNLGPATVYVGTARRSETTTANVKSDDLSFNMVGIQYRVGAVTVFASMYDGEDKNVGTAGAATEKRDLSGRQLAVSYALSKRTSAYIVMGENKDEGATANTNYKLEATALGVRHNF